MLEQDWSLDEHQHWRGTLVKTSRKSCLLLKNEDIRSAIRSEIPEDLNLWRRSAIRTLPKFLYISSVTIPFQQELITKFRQYGWQETTIKLRLLWKVTMTWYMQDRMILIEYNSSLSARIVVTTQGQED